MLKDNYKQILVLILFSFLLREVLTGATLLFVLVGALAVFFKIETTKLIRNALAMGVFTSYWLKYGKVIDPEIGLNFLTSIIVLKILERETDRDRYMIFFGLLLLISSGSLFEKSITYVVYFTLSFLILISDFYDHIGLKLKLKDLFFSLMWVFPLTFLFFFLIPRLMNPIPFQQNTMAPGEIGYTPDVNISEINSLESNDDPVFRVVTSRLLAQEELYWRGNTLSYNDGWNWKVMTQDHEQHQSTTGPRFSLKHVKQTFNLMTKSDYFFMLNVPQLVQPENELVSFKGSMRTFPQKRWNSIQRYEAFSHPGGDILEEDPRAHYLTVPLSRKDKKEIREMFPGTSLDEVSKSIKKLFLKSQFSYSLSPGKILSLKEFLERKVGVCSHYASSVAIILRLKNIPTRLVSGFMGGSYNKYANFYLISQNDAHVWVEAYSEGKWVQLDPTAWISPERVNLGGSAFIENVRGGVYKKESFFMLPAFINDLKLWFNQWDFLFYQWLETMDYGAQEEWLLGLKIKRQWLFSIIPMIMVIFMVIYALFLHTKNKKSDFNEYQDLWNLFYKKMSKKGFLLSPVSIEKSHAIIQGTNDLKVLKLWEDLRALSFEGRVDSVKELKKRIKGL